MIPYSKQSISDDDIQAVKEALLSSHLTQGERVTQFEQEIAKIAQVPYALALNSATSALYCAYHALGIKKGDEVITTPNSYVATSNMLIALGAKPVFCDIKWDGNIDESKIEALITPQTKAIVSVDYSGQSVEVDTIMAIAKAHHLTWISDSSHSFGAYYKDKSVGSFADATIFSFHAIKTITTAEGGAIVFKNKEAYQKARLMHSHGVQKKALWNSEVEQFGFNFRMNELSAALGLSQIKRLKNFIARRNDLACYYDQAFKDIPNINTLERKSYNQSTHHLYPILLDRSLWCSKEDIYQKLHELGIGVQVHYKPINSYQLYGHSTAQTPIAQEYYLSELSIPCHQEMDNSMAKEIISAIQTICLS